MIAFACSKCGQGLEADDSAVGASVNCPACNQPLQVPAAAQPTIRVAPAPQAPPLSATPAGPSAPSMPKYIRQGTAQPPSQPGAPSAPTSCPSCGSQVGVGTRFCPTCGAPMSASVTPTEAASAAGAGVRSAGDASEWCYPSNPPRSPNFAWLNVVGGTGIAQLVFGQVKKGILLMIGGNVLIFIFSSMAADENDATKWFMLLYLALLVASTIDAFKVGKCLFRGQPVKQFDWFPSAK